MKNCIKLSALYFQPLEISIHCIFPKNCGKQFIWSIKINVQMNGLFLLSFNQVTPCVNQNIAKSCAQFCHWFLRHIHKTLFVAHVCSLHINCCCQWAMTHLVQFFLFLLIIAFLNLTKTDDQGRPLTKPGWDWSLIQ